MREIRLSGSEGGETGIQPVFPTPINLATISPRSRHGLATVSPRSRHGLATVSPRSRIRLALSSELGAFLETSDNGIGSGLYLARRVVA
jgi:hypothetical protein